MPVLAACKAGPEAGPAGSPGGETVLSAALAIVEKKVRNLEKRKVGCSCRQRSILISWKDVRLYKKGPAAREGRIQGGNTL
jgi:hypothetical protein